jgi:hypothetical protein
VRTHIHRSTHHTAYDAKLAAELMSLKQWLPGYLVG